MSRRYETTGALGVLKRGLRQSPELRVGALYTIGLAIAGAAGALLVPILIQQVLDKGLGTAQGFRPEFVYPACAAAAGAIGLTYFAARATFARMVRASEAALKGLRVKTFEHIHRLSLAEQNEDKRGAFVARVTADIDTLAQFMEWAALAWFTSTTLIAGALVVMLVYSARLTAVVVVVMAPLVLVLGVLQKGLLASYDVVRTRVGELLSEVSESVMGAAVVRAYGFDEQMHGRLSAAIERRYRAQIHANRYQASIFPVSDIFGGLATAAVLGVGVWLGPSWGLTAGELIAFLFLVQLFLTPLGELSETFDLSQTAIAAWRKVIGVLDTPLELTEPSPGVTLPAGALSLTAEGVRFSYRDTPLPGLPGDGAGPSAPNGRGGRGRRAAARSGDGDGLSPWVQGQPVLRGIDLELEPGVHAAIVGATGCGKTTFAKLVCRLADPTAGRILVNGIDLKQVAPASRRSAIRMVPQDGFLFDMSVRDNVAYGAEDATPEEVVAAFEALGLDDWVLALPAGLDTQVGGRGANLSAGERQLVALARAQIAEPGILILDEATSAVDPETEAALAGALERLSKGRTTMTIAHRLSTAEASDLIVVFDGGRVVERGSHAELVAAGGEYAALYEDWLGNTRVRSGP